MRPSKKEDGGKLSYEGKNNKIKLEKVGRTRAHRREGSKQNLMSYHFMTERNSK